MKDAIFFYRESGNREKEIELLKQYLKVDPEDFEMQSMLDEELDY
ncbi:hypothetical protein [Lentilactobacillus kosonis]|uniref:Uncharacterized protein n=1 Tax=Lentilactobacillus kosonis TaxID=2810561 RepID=A0A401FL97_9LACO|nr:hypothetical protein [Lentilactobacillus kosonis]GAY73038.1 hypothetical protein NBRC111893_1184 [Lentilactobacillus kosonis]